MKMGSSHKSTLVARVTPTQRDLGWAAGFLEGEGSFNANRTSSKVVAYQVNPEPLFVLLALFGGAPVRSYPTKRNLPGRKPLYEWAVFGARARGVMMTLYPLMSKRRQEQIKRALVPRKEK